MEQLVKFERPPTRRRCKNVGQTAQDNDGDVGGYDGNDDGDDDGDVISGHFTG